MQNKIIGDGITFDDVLLVPARSGVVPRDADVRSRLTPSITLNIPIISAPMDTVTESSLAIALAQEGGIGIIHKNLSIEAQCREVDKVKRSANGVIFDPLTLRPNDTVERAADLMRIQNISGVPIVEDGNKLVGILTRRDLKFLDQSDGNAAAAARTPVSSVMTKTNLVTAPAGTSLDEAGKILQRSKVEKLLLVDANGRLAGLITMRDIDKNRQFPNSSRDERGRLRVGAAVGVFEFERVEALISNGVDVIGVDSAHGHSENVINTIREIKKRFRIEVIAGNIATADAARDLIDAGADALKVGIGPGSICTTRVVSGVGIPQITAIFNVVPVAEAAGIPVIADGGIRYSGDITKAMAAGANAVMIGSLFAGLDESPGQLVFWKGRRFKEYRGMGSIGAMHEGSADRYSQKGETDRGKLVPEGVEGRVPYRGRLPELTYQLVGGLRAGMGYCGAADIETLRRDARFVRISGAGMQESHPHNLVITEEAPNYAVENTVEIT
ncbi:MAG: IMP dehydrogenase [Phycisphaerales bacterium]|nr:IMP dehydrogenase [Phycisphaerales bacterium]MCB9855660.1 IMP dehydrogenase [Phycisphaerales bacterium]MCB9862556.1 IMP dehydrogenase [Phycisphaerales bacterium]